MTTKIQTTYQVRTINRIKVISTTKKKKEGRLQIDSFKLMRQTQSQTRIVYLTKLPFKHKGEFFLSFRMNFNK